MLKAILVLTCVGFVINFGYLYITGVPLTLGESIVCGGVSGLAYSLWK